MIRVFYDSETGRVLSYMNASPEIINLQGLPKGQNFVDLPNEKTCLYTDEHIFQNGKFKHEPKEKKLHYTVERMQNYPPVQEFLDAWVKDDKKALEDYRQKCLNVKEKYPKP